MQLPWNKPHNRRPDPAVAAAREQEAAQAAESARRQREQAERQALVSRSRTAGLRREVAKNGFTELLQQALGGH